MQVLSSQRLAVAPRGAWLILLAWALGGMVGCISPPSGAIALHADDRQADLLWLAMARGDLAGADALIAELTDERLAQRARLDLTAAREGRARALERAWELGGWWPARFLASGDAARRLLATEGRRGPALARLEDARRSAGSGRRAAGAAALLGTRPVAAEALALLVETHLERNELERARELLDEAPDTARLTWSRRRLEVATGRHRAAARGLLADWERGWITPAGVELLDGLLASAPDEELQARAYALVHADPLTGSEHQRARARLRAALASRAGSMVEARDALLAGAPLDPAEQRAVQRLEARVAGGADDQSRAARLEGVRDRPRHIDLARQRWIHEWDLAARETYRAVWAEGETLELDDYLAHLDAAAEVVDGAPRLADLPRRDFGLFGTLLDTRAWEASHPDMFVLAGAGFLMPPEITVYDRLAAEPVQRADESVDGLPVSYTRHLVRRLRVPGYLASRGARFAGVGLVDTVFLDVDEALRQAAWVERPGPEVSPRPARDRASRRSLDEPLDTAARLFHAAREQAGADWTARVLQVFDIHESRHIVDVQRFLETGVAGQLWDVIAAGMLPSAVRAEVEYRAQLDALRLADDPRIALAQAVAYLPVEGVRLQSEHAVAYERLVADVIATLDEGDWPQARPLAELGLDPQRVLVQQLHRLDAQVLRDVAAALWEG